MTTLILQNTTSILNNVLHGFKVFLQKAMLGYAMGRQCQANQQIASMLHRSGDYRPQTQIEIHMKLNRKTVDEYARKIQEIENA